MKTIRIIAIALSFCAPPVIAADSIPEPPAIFYGTVNQSPTTAPIIPTTVEWTAETTGDTATIPVSQIITIESETFYISQIPFETRKLADNTALTPTPDTLEQTSTDTTYTRSAKVDGKNALLPSGKESFTYGTPSIGQIERIDLLIGETFAEWAARVLGDENADPNADPDKDGFTNEQEFFSGTDPNNGNAQPSFTMTPNLTGSGFAIAFPTIIGQTYAIERSTNLEEPDWSKISQDIQGTGTPMTFTDTTTAPRLFYRIIAGE